jgi:hypothetical protein
MRFLRLTATVVVGLLAPAVAHAQNPWTVTLTATVNPLAIGGCGPVRLTLTDPATKAWPRNPAGNYVALSDFDLSVASVDPTGVAGEYNGPSIWSACACQGATVGSSATITAAYPAQALAPKKRVPGVALQATATFIVGAPRGSYEPASCATLKTQTVASTGAASTAAAGVGAAPIAIGTPATGPTTVAVNPPLVATAPMGATKPGGLAAASPVPSTGGSTPIGLSVTGTPAIAHFSWSPVSGATSYSVRRFSQQSATCCNASANQITATAWDDSILTPGGSYTYEVTAHFANLTSTVAQTSFVVPDPVNPASFTTLSYGFGSVRLYWSPVPNVSFYQLWGPGLPNTGLRIAAYLPCYPLNGQTCAISSQVVSGVPKGQQTWTIGSYYLPGPVSTAATSFSQVSLAVP